MMDEKKKKIGFWEAIVGCCTGTDIFVRLTGQSLLRALWHLLLLSVLLGGMMGAASLRKTAPALDRMSDLLRENFGRIEMTKAGLRPERNPESEHFVQDGKFSIWYLPRTPEAKTMYPLPKPGEVLTIWTPKKFFFLGLNREGRDYLVQATSPFGMPDSPEISDEKDLREEVAESFRKSAKVPMPEKFQGETVGFDELAKGAKIALFLLFWATFGLTFWIPALLLSMMFALVLMFSTRRWESFPYRNKMAVLAIYAGFPAMLVGALATLLELPYLEYSLIYALGMAGFMLFVLARLRSERPGEERS
ncbi:MAG: hypothetical protein PHS41_01915 [Victivallaceae bacterium]|nr:hypothetical protein [Victivallaceae bacterium]